MAKGGQGGPPDSSLLHQQSLMNGETLSVHITKRPLLPDFLQSVNLRYVKLGYHRLITHLIPLLSIPLLLGVLLEVGWLGSDDLEQLWKNLQTFDLVRVIACSAVVVFAATVYFMSRPRPIYLVDFACFLAKDDSQALKVPFNEFIKRSRNSGFFEPKSIEFQQKIMEKSGLSESTYLPPALCTLPPSPSMKAARQEAETVMYGCLDELFEKTNVKPKEIGVLVVNCSLFSPTPSLAAMIVNKYKMRSNIRSYNLAGMGCSASLISLDLARHILQVHGCTYAIVVCTENITQNWYCGNRKSMLIPNCLFRVGGAAILLSNKRKDKRRSKYKLKHVVRTHTGADDKSYQCVYQEQDSEGKMGVTLSKDLLAVAGSSLKANITALGPLVLPRSQQILYVANLSRNLIARCKFFNMKVNLAYVPDFKLAFDHFCIHAGGRAVLDGLEKELQLTEQQCEASRMTLYRFGNTSSASIWYELAYIEAKDQIKRGNQLVWQISFGSGFECNTAVWQSLCTIKPSKQSPWAHCIDTYPVQPPKSFKFD